jgi:rhodanese-related sulfurtransferase
MRELDPTQAAELMAGGNDVLFVDVRSREEFVDGHPEGAINIPIAEPGATGQMEMNQDFVTILEKLAGDPKRTILFSCRTGQRSAAACQMLEARGYVDTINLAGGHLAPGGWLSAGLPSSTENGDGTSYESIRAKTLD